MQVLLVRHGQSANNAAMGAALAERSRAGVTNRHGHPTADGSFAHERLSSDPQLTDLGECQAAALATWLDTSGLRPTRLCTSLMRRTIQTALPLAAATGLAIEVRRDLFEAAGPFLGAYEDQRPDRGAPRSELAALSPAVQLPDEATEDGWWDGPVESAGDALRRARRLAEWVHKQAEAAGPAATPDDDCLVIVSHGAIISMLLTALLHPTAVDVALENADMGAEDLPVWFAIDNTATSLVTVVPGGQTAVGWINRIDHLVALDGHEPSRIIFPFPPSLARSRAAHQVDLTATPPAPGTPPTP